MNRTYKRFFSKQSSLFFTLSFVAFSFQSCVKDNFEFDKIAEVKWDPNIAAPLIHASMTIEDMLTRTDSLTDLVTIVEGTDKSLTLIYSTELFTLDASSLVSLPNQDILFSIPAGATLPLLFGPGNTQTLSNTQTVTLGTGPGGPQIDSMTLKAGNFFISVNSDLANNGSVNITIPDAKKNGVPFSATLPLNYTGSTPVVAQTSIDLTGYKFDLTKSTGPYNDFDINYSVDVEGSSTPPSPTDQINFTMSMNNMEYRSMFGDIGKLPLSIDTDTLDLSIFANNDGAGSFSLYDPQIKVTISNSYGLPVDASFTTFQGYNPGVNFYPITGVPDPLPIISPALNEAGQTKVDSFKLDNTNSNIATLINNTPEQIILKVDIETNPAGPSQNNFILDTSRIRLDVDLILPLHGTVKEFALVDSIAFDLQEDIPDQVETGLIRLYNSNGFPIDLDLQVYMVDSAYTVLDSLLSTPNILKSGIVNSTTGRVTAPTESTIDVILNKTKVEHLKQTKHLVLSAKASTTNNGTTDVKLYSDYKLDLKLGAQLQLHIDAIGN